MKSQTYCLKCCRPRNFGSVCACMKENIWKMKAKEKSERQKIYYKQYKKEILK